MRDEREFIELEKPSEPGPHISETGDERSRSKSKGRWSDGSELGEDWVKIALGLREDLSLKLVHMQFHSASIDPSKLLLESHEMRWRKWDV